MIPFDRSLSWSATQERLDRTTDTRHGKMLETIIAHTEAEYRVISTG